MKKIITISREYGSGGRIIGELLSKELDIPFYDKELIDLAVEKSGYCREIIEKAELKAKSSLAYSLSAALGFGDNAGNSLSVNDRLFLAQFKVIREVAEKGDCVIIGRCADYVLRDIPGVTNVFIYGETEDRIKRAVEKYGDDASQAENIIATYDKARKNYYEYHTGLSWGECKNFNLTINSSYITEEKAAHIIAEYVEHRTYRD